SHIYANPGAYQIILTLVNNNGCNDTTVYPYYYGSNPSVGLSIPQATTGCAPSSFSFPVDLVIANGNTPGTTYEFTVNDGSPVQIFTQTTLPSIITHTFNNSSCGITSLGNSNAFQAQLKAINPCDVSAAFITPIRISEKADASFSINPNQIACVNQVVNLVNTTPPASSINATGCDSIVRVSWSISPSTGWTLTSGTLGQVNLVYNNSTTWGSNNPSITFTQAGNYQIKMYATGRSCGVDSAVQSICVINQVVPSFTLSNNSGCAPLLSNVLNNTPSPICGTNSYNWTVTYTSNNSCDNTPAFTFTNGTNASSFNPSFSFTNSGVYTIVLNVTNACGTVSSSQTVQVNRPPSVSINAISDFCAENAIIPSAIFDGCGSTINTYTWTFTGGTPANSALINPTPVQYNSAGNFSVSVTVSNACGSSSANEGFTVLPKPSVSISPSTASVCQGQTINLTAGGANSYTWSPASTLSSSNSSNVTATPFSSTVYNVIGVTGLCSDTAQLNVQVLPNPVVSVFVANPTLCEGETTNLTASGASTYAWTPTASLNTSSGASVIASPDINTTYTVTGTAANGCSSTQNVSVNVNPLPVVSAGTSQQFCNTNQLQTLTGFSPPGGIWSGAGVNTSGGFTPSAAGNGTWMLVYTYTDGNGCVDTSRINVIVSSPSLVNAGTGFSICELSTPTILSGASPINGTWSGNGVTGNSFNPGTAGVGQVILTYTEGTGSCAISDTIRVQVLPNPLVVVSSSPSNICFGQTTTLTASGASIYSWTPTASLNTSSGASVIATPNINTTYTVIGTAANGCSSTQNVSINVNPLPVVSAGTSQQFCNTNQLQTLTGFSPPGGIWSGAGVNTSGGFTPSAAGNGTWMLVYTYTDGNGCVDTSRINVIVSSPGLVNAGTGFSICELSTPTTLSGASPINGTWSGNGVTGNSFNPGTAGVGQTVVTYTEG
ncbi:MAG: PKD domain-containing protein, partial [Bacteroidota bacterium]